MNDPKKPGDEDAGFDAEYEELDEFDIDEFNIDEFDNDDESDRLSDEARRRITGGR